MTRAVRGQPNGRAGRMWLRHRIAVAERGADLLEQKLRVLQREEQRFALLAARTGPAWVAACADAEAWLVRGAVLSGESGVERAGAGAAATVELAWGFTMGVHVPEAAACHVPTRTADLPHPDNSALLRAADAYATALCAAVDHAAATAALEAVRADVRMTRRRRRAVEERWLPRLRQALGRLELALEEQEHDDGVRLRRTAPGTRAGTQEETQR